MTPQDKANIDLSIWQQLREAGLTPEERIQNLDDQIRIDRMLRECFSPVRADEYEHQLRLVSEEMSCPVELKELCA